jgi:hypothetical protein
MSLNETTQKGHNMKFVVTKEYGNEVDVKIHWESKNKIVKVLYWTTCIVIAIVGTGIHFVKPKKTTTE